MRRTWQFSFEIIDEDDAYVIVAEIRKYLKNRAHGFELEEITDESEVEDAGSTSS